MSHLASTRRNCFTAQASIDCYKLFKLRTSLAKLRLHQRKRLEAKHVFSEAFEEIRLRLLYSSLTKMQTYTVSEAACINVQRISRGFLAQRQAWIKYVIYSSVVLIQSFYRCRLAMKEVATIIDKREHFATEIQRFFRGTHGRKTALKVLLFFIAKECGKLKEERDIRIQSCKEAASIKIQSFGRILISRQKVDAIYQKLNREYMAEVELHQSMMKHESERRIGKSIAFLTIYNHFDPLLIFALS